MLDYLIFASGYLEKRMSVTDQIHAPWHGGCTNQHPFAPGSVFHQLETDINQEFYGIPEYLSALNAKFSLAYGSATLLRRKYYPNHAHVGYIMSVTDAVQTSTDVVLLRFVMRGSKGLGYFKNLFFCAPNGNPDGIKKKVARVFVRN